MVSKRGKSSKGRLVIPGRPGGIELGIDKSSVKVPETAPARKTAEEHMRRLRCFSPCEVEMLLGIGASYEKIEQLARDKRNVS